VNIRGNLSILHDYSFHGRAEVDTRTDTTCAGAAFALLETTGKECDVKGVHDETAPIRNVPINPEEQEENVSPELAQAEQEFI